MAQLVCHSRSLPDVKGKYLLTGRHELARVPRCLSNVKSASLEQAANFLTVAISTRVDTTCCKPLHTILKIGSILLEHSVYVCVNM